MAHTRLEDQGSPTGLKRAFFRAPIWLYRAHLGYLMGHRFLMLEHIGRRSGQIRRTVLEVVVNHPDAAYVAAAWGDKAQWLANLRMTPRARFHLGSKSYETNAVVVDPFVAGDVMAEYALKHPKALARLSQYMLDEPAATAEGQSSQIAEMVPIVRLSKGI